MISIYNIKKSTIKPERPTLLVELRGLSTDEKPTIIDNGDIENGSTFIEIDTGDIYMYDGHGKDWINLNGEASNEQSNSEEK